MSQVGQINVLFSLQMATEAKNSPAGSFSSKAGGLEGVLDMTTCLVVTGEAWAGGVVEAKGKVEAGAGGVVEAITCLASFFLQ